MCLSLEAHDILTWPYEAFLSDSNAHRIWENPDSHISEGVRFSNLQFSCILILSVCIWGLFLQLPHTAKTIGRQLVGWLYVVWPLGICVTVFGMTCPSWCKLILKLSLGIPLYFLFQKCCLWLFFRGMARSGVHWSLQCMHQMEIADNEWSILISRYWEYVVKLLAQQHYLFTTILHTCHNCVICMQWLTTESRQI